MLMLAVALLRLVVEAGVDVVGADEQGHHVRSAGDDRIQPLRDVVGELAVDAGVHELVAAWLEVGLQAVDVVGADLALRDAVARAHHERGRVRASPGLKEHLGGVGSMAGQVPAEVGHVDDLHTSPARGLNRSATSARNSASV